MDAIAITFELIQTIILQYWHSTLQGNSTRIIVPPNLDCGPHAVTYPTTSTIQ